MPRLATTVGVVRGHPPGGRLRVEQVGRTEDVVPPLALRLRPVHRDVGLAEQVVDARGVGRVEGDAGAHADRDRQTGEVDRPVEGREEPRRGGDGIVLAGDVGEQHAELVAAEAGGEIGLAQARAEAVCHRSEELVAGGMAESVVDGLEIVDIEEQHGQRTGCAAPGKRGRRVVDEPAPVGKAGERVVVGLVGQPRLEHPARGDVALEQSDEPGQSHQDQQ